MKPAELQREIAAEKIRPGYLLAGGEPLLRDDSLAAIREAVLRGGPEDFNLDVLDGASATPATLADSIALLPIMAERRLVILREPEARRGASSKALLEALTEILTKGLEDSGTVLVVTASKADKRSRWVKAFVKSATLVDCDPPKRPRDVIGFVRDEAALQEVKLGPGVAELLAERIGPQLLMLRQEIAKLSLLAGQGNPVTRQHASEGAIDVAEEPIWDLTDAIGDGRSAEALVGLNRILSAGTPAPVVLGSLAAHFRKLVRLRSGGSVSAPPFVVKKLEGQARRYAPARLVACLRAIHEVDEILKGRGNLAPKLALERLVLGLAG